MECSRALASKHLPDTGATLRYIGARWPADSQNALQWFVNSIRSALADSWQEWINGRRKGFEPPPLISRYFEHYAKSV